MKPNLIFRALLGIISLVFSTACLADTILDTTTSLLQNDPIQWGRISRNGEPQDWIGSEPFGGIVNPDWQFHYHTYVIPSATLSHGRYVQIHLDDLGLEQGNIFVSAYANSYDPTSLSTNWLGDAGTSGNLAGTNPVFFQVLAPSAADLVIVVWNTDPTGGLGVGERFRLLAEQFTDVTYTEPVLTSTINLNASASVVKPGTTCTLTFTASPALVSTTTVNYATSGTAVLGTDYKLSGGPDQVTFSPGQTSATVTLTAIKQPKDQDNPPKQPAVSATVTIQNGTGYTIGPNNSASVTIRKK